MKSANPVLNSPPFPRAAARISAMNSGKLLRHAARIVVTASLSSFSFLPDLLTSTSSHFSWSAERFAVADRARNAFLSKFRLINEMREDVVEVNKFRSGVTKVMNVDSIFEGRGASSARSLYSSYQEGCYSGKPIQNPAKLRTWAVYSKLSTHLPSSLPATTPSKVSALSTIRFPYISRHLRHQAPRMSA